MSPRAWRERIRDMLDAVAEITAFTQGIAFDTFRYDAKTMRAVDLDCIPAQASTSTATENATTAGKHCADQGGIPMPRVTTYSKRVAVSMLTAHPWASRS